jgi:hypothetical protein
MGVFGIALACNDIFSTPDIVKDSPSSTAADDGSLARHDYLALLKTQESHKASVDELQKIVAGILNITPESRSVGFGESVITGIKQLPVSNSRHFVAFAEAGRSVQAESETGPVEIYEFSVGQPDSNNEGFVLASNDDRIGNILAIAEGSLENASEEYEAVLNANLRDYIDSTI